MGYFGKGKYKDQGRVTRDMHATWIVGLGSMHADHGPVRFYGYMDAGWMLTGIFMK